ncbi:hypothetical protein TDB9533_03062 [Thalassocella blandensis]|nr:hypothetical protein TDB9533_03062 [Thalassocella blandensis]
MLLKLASRSLLSRKVNVGLTVFSISISIFIMLAIGHVKNEAKASFTSVVSGVDLIVGARTGQINLLLYSIFRIGQPTNNISWESYQALSARKEVAWTIPISLGDSHKGFRVLGTSSRYFSHFKYGNKRELVFSNGEQFNRPFDVVLGADVARSLQYSLGDKITLSHGVASTSFSEHANNPFTVVGILKPTGTSVDQTLHVPLEGIEAIHSGWQSGVNLSQKLSSNDLDKVNLTPKTITAFMVGLKSKMATFTFQRQVNQFQPEALMAILPGVSLAELWRMMGVIEGILLFISSLVLLAALIGMSTMMLTAIRERRKEFFVLRVIGASPWFIMCLIQAEAILITLLGMCVAILLLWTGILFSQDLLASHFGFFLSLNIFNREMLMSLALVLVIVLFVSCIPAISSTRHAQL